MSGTGLAQLITIAVTPILTRIYTPEAFGVFSIYTTIVATLAVVTTFRYEMSIALPQKRTESINILFFTLAIAFVFSFFYILISLIFRDGIATLLNLGDLSDWLWLIPISALLMGIYNIFNYWSIRNREFKRLSYSRVTQSGGTVTAQIVLGLINLGQIGLLFGQIFGYTIGTFTLIKQVLRKDKRNLLRSISFKIWMKLIFKYKDFALYSSPQALLNASSKTIPPLVLGIYFNPATVGYYALGVKLIQMPIALVGDSFNQVFFGRLATLKNENKLVSNQMLKMTAFLASIAFIPSLLIFLFSPTLFEFFLGEGWGNAGLFSRYLIIWLFFSFINRGAVVSIQVMGMQRGFLIYEVLLFSIRLIGLVISVNILNAVDSILIYSLIGALFNMILIIIVYINLKIRENKL